MKTFIATHPETGDIEEISGRDLLEAAEQILFRYCEGDCDVGADTLEELEPGLWEATREGSFDYFHIKEKE